MFYSPKASFKNDFPNTLFNLKATSEYYQLHNMFVRTLFEICCQEAPQTPTYAEETQNRLGIKRKSK